jgi:DNA-binding response OmpR family regulator
MVRQAGEPIFLTPKEFDLLVLLIKHVDEALSREVILQQVWGYCFVGETRTVDMHIMQLRKKLDFQDRLKAVVKIGYRLDS